jgi:sterol desaturase/sphingolipid hydroxylase (fatty acid hydroxylase superfamily)
MSRGFFQFDLSLVRPISAFALMGLLLCLEWRLPFRAPLQAKFHHAATNLVIGGTNAMVANLLMGGLLLFLIRQVETQGWGLLPFLELGLLANSLASIVLLDLIFFGFHWANHYVPFLWRFHRAHHSDLDLDVTTSQRFHIGEVLISTLIKAAAIAALGVSWMGLVMFEVLLQAATQFQHSNLGLPAPLDKGVRLLLVTPHMHWIHHSRHPREHNANFGTILSVWDRLFGTYFIQTAQEEIRVGLEQYPSLEQVGLFRFLGMPLAGACQPGPYGPP